MKFPLLYSPTRNTILALHPVWKRLGFKLVLVDEDALAEVAALGGGGGEVMNLGTAGAILGDWDGRLVALGTTTGSDGAGADIGLLGGTRGSGTGSAGLGSGTGSAGVGSGTGSGGGGFGLTGCGRRLGGLEGGIFLTLQVWVVSVGIGVELDVPGVALGSSSSSWMNWCWLGNQWDTLSHAIRFFQAGIIVLAVVVVGEAVLALVMAGITVSLELSVSERFWCFQ